LGFSGLVFIRTLVKNLKNKKSETIKKEYPEEWYYDDSNPLSLSRRNSFDGYENNYHPNRSITGINDSTSNTNHEGNISKHIFIDGKRSPNSAIENVSSPLLQNDIVVKRKAPKTPSKLENKSLNLNEDGSQIKDQSENYRTESTYSVNNLWNHASVNWNNSSPDQSSPPPEESDDEINEENNPDDSEDFEVCSLGNKLHFSLDPSLTMVPTKSGFRIMNRSCFFFSVYIYLLFYCSLAIRR
jgi:hypothetical protein